VRSRLTTRLGAALWRFLGQHEKHIAEAIGMSAFSIVTTVPGTRQRDGNHPLEQIVGMLVGQTKDRYEPLLSLGQGVAPSHSIAADRYLATRALRGGPAVLLIDDTWTTGGNAQSAALALRAAGAAKVAIVVIGRHFDRSFRDCETYYQQAKSTRFTWDSCCLELGAAALASCTSSSWDRCEQTAITWTSGSYLKTKAKTTLWLRYFGRVSYRRAPCALRRPGELAFVRKYLSDRGIS
jgi:hypothetical protein